ncbi:hypothetical protein BX666DRAFT_1894703, partial [Dichotomocladium elegans]
MENIAVMTTKRKRKTTTEDQDVTALNCIDRSETKAYLLEQCPVSKLNVIFDESNSIKIEGYDNDLPRKQCFKAKPKRRQIGRFEPCTNCIKQQIRDCSGQRPCQFCATLGLDETCVGVAETPCAECQLKNRVCSSERPCSECTRLRKPCYENPLGEKVERRCVACRRTNGMCSNQRPCPRCVALGKGDSCRDKPGRYADIIRCNYCRRHNLKCSGKYPCLRCVSLGIDGSCSNIPVKRRKKSSKKSCCCKYSFFHLFGYLLAHIIHSTDNCYEDCVSCSSSLPCSRCIKLGIGELCVELPPEGVFFSRCSSCEGTKAKCEKERPCSRCVKLGRADRCSDPVIKTLEKRKPELNSYNGPYREDTYIPYKQLESKAKKKGVDGTYTVFAMYPSALENPLPLIDEIQPHSASQVNNFIQEKDEF